MKWTDNGSVIASFACLACPLEYAWVLLLALTKFHLCLAVGKRDELGLRSIILTVRYLYL